MKIIPLIIVCLFSLSVQAESIDDLLDKMMLSMKMNNYQGTLVIRQKDKLQALHVKHGMNDNGVWESIESLSGEARQVIRQDNRLTTIFPERKLITVSHDDAFTMRHQLPKNRSVLKKYYHLNLLGKDRVAKKVAYVLSVEPKDKFRYGYRYWLDEDTGLLLKCDLLDQSGQVIEQLIFSDLRVLATSPQSRDFLDKAKDYQVIDLDKDKQKKHISSWQAQSLPSGFMLSKVQIKAANQGKDQVLHLIYSDGMSSVSVFVEKHMQEEKAFDGASNMGAINAYGLHLNNYHITAIGEVPPATVHMIAGSMQYLEQ